MKKSILRIAYSNIEGLDINKFAYAANTLARSFAIVFLAETWHINIKHDSHPFFVCSSPLVNVNPHGRQHGGILLISSVKHLISQYETNEFFILIRIAGLTIVAVYLPPRLSPEQVEAILETIPSCDIILGDFNARYGARTGDSISNNPDRRAAINLFTNRFGLQMHLPDCGQSHNDHVFSNDAALRWEYVHIPQLFARDHDTMLIETSHFLKSRSTPRFLTDCKNLPASPPQRSAADILTGRFGDSSDCIRR
jgi:hypothetical protein